jgi:tight adherence protein B
MLLKNFKLTITISTLFILTGYIFYDSFLIGLIFTIFTPRILKLWINKKKSAYKLQKLDQFQQALNSLYSGISSGKSIENALRQTSLDLRQIYPINDTFILIELDRIIYTLSNGATVEKAFYEFSNHAELDEVSQFTETLLLSLKKGVNLRGVFKRSSELIRDKFEVNNEISIMIAQKKFESYILVATPILFVGFMKWSSPEFMEPLYSNQGKVIMTVALCCFSLSSYFIHKILDLKL